MLRNKGCVYLVILLILFLDLWSTYLFSGGEINRSNELHFIVQLFGGGFNDLALIFVFEAIILIALTYAAMKLYQQKQALTKHKPALKILKRKQKINTLDWRSFVRMLPFVVAMILAVHFVAAINNFLLYIHSLDPTATNFPGKVIRGYVNFIHLGKRLYYIYMIIFPVGFLFYYGFKRLLGRGNVQFNANERESFYFQ
ncbi:hypothetical protein H8S90_15320 [Olivibacter sp. SDN3]|uniref:hypothetical protein n=1 Tax=Olivibacter sp. SDN3 TaxID=2764720 RepID=UPI0016513060|nr:hypothetical protein [Olivibacter sp. SDN3]QNL48170.1 hypothetical protein H8S90_15320 [Olivibacter sp. SDN3]